MGEITAISWCDHTHNHWIGCMKVSPACDGCYAEAMMDKRYKRVEWGEPGKGPGTRVLTSEANRRKPLAWNRKAAENGTRPFVFCSSLADVFDNQVEPEWREDLFELIRVTPRLVWLLLTKRPQNIAKMVQSQGAIAGNGTRYLPGNAAIGTTVEDQERAINLFRLAVAAGETSPLFTFASFEPLLGPVDPTRISVPGARMHFNALQSTPIFDLPALGWAITGGETDQGGHKARPTHPEWFRGLRDQCAAAGTAYHHKQNGEFSDFDHIGMAWNDLPPKIQEQQKFIDGKAMIKVGKHRSGRLLDGVEHDARPAVRS